MKNKKNNLNYILEIFWLVVAILLAAMSIYISVKSGLKEAGMFFLMMTLSSLLFFARRIIRRKNEKE